MSPKTPPITPKSPLEDAENNHRLHRFLSILPHHKHFVNTLPLFFSLLAIFALVLNFPTLPATAATCKIDKSTLHFYSKNDILYYCPKTTEDTPPMNYCDISGDTSTNAGIIFSSLVGYGYNETSAAAIVGNLIAESGFNINPTIIEGGKTVDESWRLWNNGRVLPPKTGFGIAQWTTDARQRALQDYADHTSQPVTTLKTQIEYLISETMQPGLISNNKDVTVGHMNSLSLEDAVREWMFGFENPLDKSDAKVNSRLSYATQILSGYAVVCEEEISEDNPSPSLNIDLENGESTEVCQTLIPSPSTSKDSEKTCVNITNNI